MEGSGVFAAVSLILGAALTSLFFRPASLLLQFYFKRLAQPPRLRRLHFGNKLPDRHTLSSGEALLSFLQPIFFLLAELALSVLRVGRYVEAADRVQGSGMVQLLVH